MRSERRAALALVLLAVVATAPAARAARSAAGEAGLGLGCAFGNLRLRAGQADVRVLRRLHRPHRLRPLGRRRGVACRVIEPAWRGDYALTADAPDRREGARVHRTPGGAPRGPGGGRRDRRCDGPATGRLIAPRGARTGLGRYGILAGAPHPQADTMTDPLSLASLATAFAAGLLSVLSPCVMPLMPAYLSLISGISVEELRAEGEIRAEERAAGCAAACCVGLRGLRRRASRRCSCCSAPRRRWSGTCSRPGRWTSSACRSRPSRSRAS